MLGIHSGSAAPLLSLVQPHAVKDFVAEAQNLHILEVMVFWKKCLVRPTQQGEWSGCEEAGL